MPGGTGKDPLFSVPRLLVFSLVSVRSSHSSFGPQYGPQCLSLPSVIDVLPPRKHSPRDLV